jgi:hypothetical protein
MYRPDQYLAVVVGLMFLGGLLLTVLRVRQRSKIRKQERGTGPAHRNSAA